LGSGTTLIAAALDNRRGVGVDVDLEYCELAKKRLIKEAHILDEVLIPAGNSHGAKRQRRSKVAVRSNNGIFQEKPK
jgi:predicted O-methyltransferase YrrM